MNPSSLVIFDCDGVLVDSEPLQIQALLDVAAPLGFSMPLVAAVERFRGAKMADVVAVVEGQIGTAVPPDFVPRVRARQAEAFARELRAVEGVREAILAIPVARCVASSGPLEKIHLSLTITGLLDLFGDNLFSAYTIGRWKPDPGLFLHAAARMGVAPGDCVVVEDSVLGVQAGVAAGMRVLGYADEGRRASLAAAGAEVFVAMRELPGRIRGPGR
jgi:HAD superfamily hydrolase (TIGR01509 family)